MSHNLDHLFLLLHRGIRLCQYRIFKKLAKHFHHFPLYVQKLKEEFEIKELWLVS